jgi:hypothetical protein
MQGNPPQELLLSVDTSDYADGRINRGAHSEKELKFSRNSVASPRKFGDHAILSTPLNRRHGFMELSPSKSSPRQPANRQPKESPSIEHQSPQPGAARDETVDVAQLNSLLQSSINKLSSLENEKNDRYERWKQEVDPVFLDCNSHARIETRRPAGRRARHENGGDGAQAQRRGARHPPQANRLPL